MKHLKGKCLSRLLLLLMVGSVCISCAQGTDVDTSSTTGTDVPGISGTTGTDEKVDQPVPSEGLNLSDVRLIYEADVSDTISRAVKSVKSALTDAGIEAEFASDSEEVTDCEILIGQTNRPESAAAAEQLPEGNKHAFAILRTGEKIAIAGSDEDALIRGCQYFVNELAAKINGGIIQIAEDYQYMEGYNTNTVWTKTLGGFEILQSATVYGPTRKDSSPDLTYSRIIELSHNGEQNGTLIATGESLNVNSYLIHRSTDGGKTFENVGSVRAKSGKMIANWQPMLYELPCAVGDLPEGTILLAGCTRNSSSTQTEMTVYASSDLGESWSTVSTVAEGGGFGQVNGLSNGLWEPFLLCDENGKLYCFYSDETDCTRHSQMIVCRSSEDGVNWSETQRITACADPNLRPGMPTVTKMGNGKYFLTYEMVGMYGNPVYYKTTDDLSDWGNPENIGRAVQTNSGVSIGSAPYCCWIPGGSEKGTLIVTAKNMVGGSSTTGTDWLVSYDYGRSWTNIDNPLPYHDDGSGARYAYSPAVFAGSDGRTLYYVNNINSEQVSGKAKIQLAVLKVHGFGSCD